MGGAFIRSFCVFLNPLIGVLRTDEGIFIIKQKPPAMPVDKRKTTQALAAERSRYTKKLLCAKLNVRLATVHK